ncbi:MAG: redox-regulated ATPase YchF [Abditibacteriota bacterium]|nr:redox-regulated ATPase YchF [Abditibacteriota bacterium]
MIVGIVGLPSSGKTTLFRALTRGTVKINEYGSGKPNVGVVNVPDERIDYFAKQYNPKKTTYASIQFIDGAAKVDTGGAKFGADFFADVRRVDALVHVVAAFPDASRAMSNLHALNDELLLADMQMVENRMERIEKQLHGVKKGALTPATIENALLERLKDAFENGKPLKSMDFSADEMKFINSYSFLTLKPMIIVLNVAEDMIGSESEEIIAFRKYCEEELLGELELCAEIEMEVAELPDEEEAEFLASMGIKEPARNALIKKTYEMLGLISFITAGEPEVRAWTIHKGETAIDAAGTIHSDIARGFIRAEVANFKQIEEVGSWEEAKRQGIVTLQGKDYVVQDGDVMYIRNKV